ncbi:MAG: trimeric autotransporter adhesin, partial [Actinomycetota bacterium]|nr:trimeric autotransporter adhesin [Actinomycetota bacterium]
KGGRRLDDPDDFVRLEIAAALERDIMVLPVLVEDAAMPGAADLPEQLAPLARRNAIEISDSRWTYDVGRLVVRLENLQAAKASPPAGGDASTAPGATPPAPADTDGAPPSADVAPAPASAGTERLPPAPGVAPAPPPPQAGTPATRGRVGWPLAVVGRRKWWVLGLVAALIAVGVGFTLLSPDSPDDGGSSTGQGPAELSSPAGLAVGGGALYVADYDRNRIVKVTPTAISVVAGTGDSGSEGNGGPATSAELSQPGPIALDPSGSLYLSEPSKGGIRKVGADGTITSVVLHSPGVSTVVVQAMAVGPDGALLVATDHDLLKVGPDGTLVALAGQSEKGFAGDGGPATAAKLDSPAGVAVDAAYNVYVADKGNNRIRRIGADGIITTVAGTGKSAFSGMGAPAVEAALDAPRAVAVDSQGVVYLAAASGVAKIGPDGKILLVAGDPDGSSGFSGDDGPAQDALLDGIVALAVDADGALYLSDAGNSRVRRISTDGIITTVA